MNTKTITPIPVLDKSSAERFALVGHSLLKLIYDAAIALAFPLAVLVFWQYAASHRWLPEQILPSPVLVWQSFLELLGTGELANHLLISIKRVLWSVAVGGSAGLLLGFAIGMSRRASAYLFPCFEVVAQFPVVGWIPLLMIFLGIEESLKIAAVSLAVVVPVTVSTYKGIHNIPRALLEVGRAYRFSKAQTLLKIVVPAALPSIFSGLRQGIMQAWLSLVFVELLASSEGIGYLMVWGRQLMQMDLVFVAIIVIGVVGFVLDWALSKLESRLHAWHQKAF